MLLEILPAQSASEFSSRLLHFINCDLPRLDRRARNWPQVDATTPLFAHGLLDSLSILHLIAAIEGFTGRPVPDELVVMNHFQTVEAISSAFWLPEKP